MAGLIFMSNIVLYRSIGRRGVLPSAAHTLGETFPAATETMQRNGTNKISFFIAVLLKKYHQPTDAQRWKTSRRKPQILSIIVLSAPVGSNLHHPIPEVKKKRDLFWDVQRT